MTGQWAEGWRCLAQSTTELTYSCGHKHGQPNRLALHLEHSAQERKFFGAIPSGRASTASVRTMHDSQVLPHQNKHPAQAVCQTEWPIASTEQTVPGQLARISVTLSKHAETQYPSNQQAVSPTFQTCPQVPLPTTSIKSNIPAGSCK